MHGTYQAVLGVHVVAALLSVGTFWISAIARKGAPLHVRSGAFYVRAMIVMAVTSLIMCVMNTAAPLTMTPLEAWQARKALLGGDPSNVGADAVTHLARLNAVWLAYLSLLLLFGLRHGLQVVRARRDPAAGHTRADVGVALAFAASGPAMIAFGVAQQFPVISFFGVVGLMNGLTWSRFLLRPPRTPMAWWFQHMNAMLGTGTSLHVAALLALGRHLPGPAGTWRLWPVLLTLAAIPAAAAWRRYYRRRFAGTAAGRPRPAAQAIRAA
jgi:hypothetical protein